jgi:hypothetical protein
MMIYLTGWVWIKIYQIKALIIRENGLKVKKIVKVRLLTAPIKMQDIP